MLLDIYCGAGYGAEPVEIGNSTNLFKEIRRRQ
jgi:hypothetical protein